MHRLLTILPLVAVLAGCSDVLSAPPASPLPQQGAHAGFQRGGVADLIRVDALDTLPLRTAELVSPDGATFPASYVQARETPHDRSGSAIYQSTWLDHTSAIGGTPALFRPQPTAAVYSQSELLLMVSTADIPLPDPVAYRRDWTHYRIRLGFAGPGGRLETRELAAPEPPPPPQG
jgi:hypothetical protein